MIIEQNDNEIIIGAKDKHLTFHVSLFCSDVKDKTQEVSITTIVKYEIPGRSERLQRLSTQIRGGSHR